MDTPAGNPGEAQSSAPSRVRDSRRTRVASAVALRPDCHLIFSASCRAERSSSIAWRVNRPIFSAFLLPCGAPDAGAPPCMRQRFLPLTAGDMQGLPERVFGPQQRLDCIGPVLRG